jgi:hypothetical protein
MARMRMEDLFCKTEPASIGILAPYALNASTLLPKPFPALKVGLEKKVYSKETI